jgi:hypothetical protein
MRVTVNYEDTDVAKSLSKIIKDPNSEEFVKLLTPILCNSSYGVEHFFKLMIGNKLPDIIPIGTLCKMDVLNVGYGMDKELTKQKFADQDDKIVVSVKEFRGYHEYSPYIVEYTGVVGTGTTKLDTVYLREDQLEVIEEF